jgi:ribonuclease J
VSAFFTPLPSLGKVEPEGYSDRQPIQAGPFTITPFRVDHSAYDSHCLLIEAEGKRLFYSGDIRGHGRNADLFQGLISNPPPDIDVLICEGTQIGRDPNFAYPDEHSVADKMVEIFEQTKGMGLVWCSSQNIDRLISVWDAAKRSNRKLILDVYTAEIIRAADDEALPKPGKDGVQVYLPVSQRSLIIREKAFNISNKYRRPHRTFPEDLAEAAPNSVMIFRPSMLRDMKKAECLDSAVLITSIWSGYLPKEAKRIDEMKSMGVGHVHVHTSGHATVDELKDFVSAFPQSRIVPIHLEDRDGFLELSPNVELQNDHEWWGV